MVDILVTCTSPRCHQFISDLDNARALPALIVSLINTPKPTGDFDAMLITSRHGVVDGLPDLPIITVGKDTIPPDTQKNYNIAQVGTGAIKDLDLTPYHNIFYPCSTEPTCIPVNCTPWHVYKTEPNIDFKIDETIDVVCVFSVKAAKVIKQYDLTHKIVLCLSQNIADIFRNSAVQKLAVCTRPRYDDMKSLILNET